MGRTKQPVDLILLNGKKHLTKEEIKERKESEVKADTDKVEAPSHLTTKKQKERFDFLAQQLLNANIMTNLDVETLARYVKLEEQYNNISKKITRMNVLNLQYDSLLKKQTKVFSMLDKLNNQLCFNILSRNKATVPKDKQEKPKNKFSKFGAKNG